jgi:hypothetical protein
MVVAKTHSPCSYVGQGRVLCRVKRSSSFGKGWQNATPEEAGKSTFPHKTRLRKVLRMAHSPPTFGYEFNHAARRRTSLVRHFLAEYALVRRQQLVIAPKKHTLFQAACNGNPSQRWASSGNATRPAGSCSSLRGLQEVEGTPELRLM